MQNTAPQQMLCPYCEKHFTPSRSWQKYCSRDCQQEANKEKYALLDNRPIARTNDPETSHMAAEKVTANGTRASQQKQCLQGVIDYPNHTSAELARMLGLDRHTVARRLPELEPEYIKRNKEKRKCDVTGQAALTWREK